MVTSNSRVLPVIGLLITFVVIVFPLMMLLFVSSEDGVARNVIAGSAESNVTIIIRTLLWAIGVGAASTSIGWPIGVRIASLSPTQRSGILAGLMMTLAIPAYAVFYAWWQAWPAGTWVHDFLVEHSLIQIAMKVCVAFALVGWSWPIAALFATMASKTNNALTTLYVLDGLSLAARCWQRFVVDWRLLVSSILLISSITAANTTCFDLAQVATIGNELRAIVATGGSIVDVPLLSFVGLCIAFVASLILFRFVTFGSRSWTSHTRSPMPVLIVWLLLSGGPLFISAFASLRGGGLQLWKHYEGDMLMSGGIGISVALLCLVVFLTSVAMHLSTHRKYRMLAGALDFIWVLFAFLPASFISTIYTNVWNYSFLDIVYRSPAILVLAHLARVGFIGALAGRWIASSKQTRVLCAVDGVQSPRHLFAAIRPQLFASAIVVAGITMAMSIGEVAMTSQLSPPSTHQPIAVALLNAMHYQRPEIVTSALCIIIAVALLGGILIVFAHRKLLVFTVLLFVPFACEAQEETPIPNARVIGGVGLVDGRFFTPRAIAADDQVLVVIDKSGRLQRFDLDWTFLSSWELQLSGKGFPTGVSIDKDGMIWIADTHEHRILVLDQEGSVKLEFGSYGTGDGQFLYPTDIAFGRSGEVYVSEYGGNDRISIYNKAGVFQRAFGHHGEDISGFKRPQAIAIEPSSGRLFITDSGNHRVVICEPDGKVIRTISSVGRQFGQLLYPYGIVFISPTTFLVTEFGNNRLQEFSTDGDAIAIWGGAGDQAGTFKTPWGIVLTRNGIMIADTGNNRLELLPYIISNR